MATFTYTNLQMTLISLFSCFLGVALVLAFQFMLRSIEESDKRRKEERKAEREELASLIAQRLRVDEGRDEPHSEG